ncbi:hypothetical protein D3C71_1873990 [compost metagenome]
MEKRKQYITNEVRSYGETYFGEVEDSMVEKVVNYLYANYNIDVMNDRDLDSFVDSSVIENTYDLIERGLI